MKTVNFNTILINPMELKYIHILDDNKVAKLLLKSGANLHAKNNAGEEPLDVAVERCKIFKTFKFCDKFCDFD